MDVFLMIRRKNTTIFTDAKESSSVLELKKIVEGIIKTSPENQHIWKDDKLMEDDKCLSDYGITNSVAKAQCPATVCLATKQPDGVFEQPEITSLSTPPELPDVMKVQESQTIEQTATN